jgi:hypothetical protein
MTLKELYQKNKKTILALIVAVGITPAAIVQVGQGLQSKIVKQSTTSQVSTAQIQSLQPILYTGKVEIFRSKMFGLWKKSEGIYPVQIRYTDYYIPERNESLTMLWAYIRVMGEMEKYHVIPFNESFYFYDWNMDRQWIYDIRKTD